MGGLGLVGLSGCTGAGGGGTPTPRVERETVVKERTVVRERTVEPDELSEVSTIEPEGGLTIPMFLYGIQEGAWRQFGIDLDFEVAAFGKFQRQVVQNLTEVGGLGIIHQPKFVNEGEDVLMYGQQMNFINGIHVHADSDIEDVTDLRGKKVGMPGGLGSSVAQTLISIFLRDFDFDLREETAELIGSPPPVLWELFMDGEVDAMSQFTGFTVRAESMDEVRTIFNVYDYWTEDHDFPPPLTNFTSQRSWLEENPDLAWNFVQGHHAAAELFREETEVILQNFGRLGGVSDPAEAEVVKDWMDRGRPFGPLEYSDAFIDDNYDYLTLLHETGELEELPDKDDLFVSSAALRDMI